MITWHIKNSLRRALSITSSLTGQTPRKLSGKVICLMYHRVLKQPDLDRYHVQPGMYVCDDVFERHIAYLKKHFRILSFSELLGMWREKSWDQKQRYCVITFDDGWLDNYVNAYPILQKYKAPATIFIPTGLIGTAHWFWPDRVSHILSHCFNSPDKSLSIRLYDRWPWLKNGREAGQYAEIDRIMELFKKKPAEEISRFIEDAAALFGLSLSDERALLNWSEAEVMAKNGISFGSHSVSHAILTTLAPEQVQEEIENSLQTLQTRAVNHVPVFCYPNGNCSREITDQVRSAGYAAAVTTHFGYEGSSPENLFMIKRIGVHNDICETTSLFRWHISGGNKIFRRY